MAVGTLAGTAAAAALAPLIRPLFSPPAGGVGLVTVANYPKSWDYAVIALLIAGPFLGALLSATATAPVADARRVGGRFSWIGYAVVFVLMLFIHDHPYHHMDPFHEGEHLTPAFVLRDGGRPYKDIFFLHGFATDGGLDALVLGDPPSPRRARRLETVLDAATLALLVPIAAQLCATPLGAAAAVIASLCGLAAGQLPVFPWFRLAPVLLAALGLLRYARGGRFGPLLLALSASTLGVLWSLDTGTYALAATAITLVVLRKPWKQVAVASLIAAALPLMVLLATRADLRQFFIDSFVIIPRAIDAVWSLPAPTKWNAESARYYLPPVFYGFLLALGIKRRDPRMIIIAIASIFVFRTAAGRFTWSHTRYGVPLFGAAAVAFVIEPLVLWSRRRLGGGNVPPPSRWRFHWMPAVLVTVVLAFLVELPANTIAAAKFLAGWRARQSHAGMVPYPFATGKGIYTYEANANDLAALNGFIESVAGPDGRFLDVSGERALYYLLQRRPPIRCPDINMLSAPALFNEAIAQLEARPPACVVIKGIEIVGKYDGLDYTQRVPALAQWIDANYPARHQIGRFTVATRGTR